MEMTRELTQLIDGIQEEAGRPETYGSPLAFYADRKVWMEFCSVALRGLEASAEIERLRGALQELTEYTYGPGKPGIVAPTGLETRCRAALQGNGEGSNA